MTDVLKYKGEYIMTICIGLIPNNKTVMLMQDSEITYQQLGFTQDIFHKIRTISDDAIVGVIGGALLGNEVLEAVPREATTTSSDLRQKVEEAYHQVRERKLRQAVLRKYGFSHIREVLQPQKDLVIDPAVREEVLKAANDSENSMNLTLMLASNIERPQLYRVQFPGIGVLEDNVKMYSVSGSGSIMALDKMGEELDRYRWRPTLSIDESIDILLRTGKASEKHIGVGGPFDIAYITKGEDGKNRTVEPDKKKINMVMYLLPLRIDEKVVLEAITRMRDDKVNAAELGEYIKTNTGVGIDFDRYFGLNGQ